MSPNAHGMFVMHTCTWHHVHHIPVLRCAGMIVMLESPRLLSHRSLPDLRTPTWMCAPPTLGVPHHTTDVGSTHPCFAHVTIDIMTCLVHFVPSYVLPSCMMYFPPTTSMVLLASFYVTQCTRHVCEAHVHMAPCAPHTCLALCRHQFDCLNHPGFISSFTTRFDNTHLDVCTTHTWCATSHNRCEQNAIS